jgi:hypothetical protein
MASAIRQMTGVGGDVRKIARLLQKKAPPGHMLAYINQEEADLLKARGGSGKPHADTGVPSFEEIPYDYSSQLDYSPTGGGTAPSVYKGDTSYGDAENLGTINYAAPETSGLTGIVENRLAKLGADYSPTGIAAYSRGQSYGAPTDVAVSPASSEGTIPFRDISGSTPRETGARETFDASVLAPGGSQAPTPQDKDLLGKAQDYFSNLSPETKKLLGLTAVGSIPALIGAYTTQQASEQARKAKEEMMARSAPYKAQADEMITKARSGELTPVGQQQLQAVQAQAAQAAQGRGGVAAQQAMTQVEAYRQQLLQGQYDYGLKLAGISDQIAMGAIKTGLEADRYINAATMDYFNNAIRMFQGQSPQVAGRQPTDTTAPRG